MLNLLKTNSWLQFPFEAALESTPWRPLGFLFGFDWIGDEKKDIFQFFRAR
jgi:hypothetical protein